MSWNWLLADNEYRLYRQESTVLAAGGFLMSTKIRPVYAWDDGSVRMYMRGDRAKPNMTTLLQGPGPRSPASKIMPFSVSYGVQLQDRKFHYLLSPQLKRQKAPFIQNSKREEAVSMGMRAIRLPYSGESATATTVALHQINHGVKPATQALDCLNCHGPSAGFDWRKPGYQQDPWTNSPDNIQPSPAVPASPSIGLPPVKESVLPVPSEMVTRPAG
ncbi:MAG TPA: hypothetical protein ENK89_05290 [Desulfobulbaceae bacterium]|nr:hypothetical protein [Desulfobulbaceae bacterium]